MLLWDIRAPQHVGAFGPPDPSGRPKCAPCHVLRCRCAGWLPAVLCLLPSGAWGAEGVQQLQVTVAHAVLPHAVHAAGLTP